MNVQTILFESFTKPVLFPGVGLMEIVTEPDFRTPEEATSFVRELQTILRRLGTCDGKMEGKRT